MNTVFQSIANQNHWLLLWPELAFAFIGIAILLLGICLPQRWHLKIVGAGIVAQLFVFSFMAGFFKDCFANGSVYNFSGLIQHTSLGNSMRLFFALNSTIVSYLSYIYLKNRLLPKTECITLVCFVNASFMLLVQSNHFLMLFMSLETASIALYVLVGYYRSHMPSVESSIKYLILSSLSAAILLMGIVLLYGIGGNPHMPAFSHDSLQFQNLEVFMQVNSSNHIVIIGTMCVLCGILFKIGIFPFQIWIPDVYAGSPSPTAALLATASKAAGIILLLILLQGPFEALSSMIYPLLTVLTLCSILFANIAAATQKNVKRLMGLSGVAHAGYLMLGILAAKTIPWASGAVVFYLFTYLLSSGLVFGVITHFDDNEILEKNKVIDYQLLWYKNPTLSTILAIGLGSLAGVPPLLGFIGKLLLLIAAFQAQLWVLLIVAVIGIVISMYYYFGWMREVFFATNVTPPSENTQPSLGIMAYLPLMTISALVIVLGCFQGFLGKIIFSF